MSDHSDYLWQGAACCIMRRRFLRYKAVKPSDLSLGAEFRGLGMQYSCPGIGDVRLMVGVRKRDKTKIQYCITSLIPVSRMKKEQP